MDYDLVNRTTKFSKDVYGVLKNIKPDYLNRNLISQLARSSTSIGANYNEANNAASPKDFINKMVIARKEIQETKYWIELLVEDSPQFKIELITLAKEAHELLLIFVRIITSTRQKLAEK